MGRKASLQMTQRRISSRGPSSRRSDRRTPRAHAGRAGEARRVGAGRSAAIERRSRAARGRTRRRMRSSASRRVLFEPLAIQRASAVLRLHHVEPGADWHARRSAGRCGEPELRSVDAWAERQRDRSADRAVDCRVHRVAERRDRRLAGERREHGKFRLLSRRANGQSRLGRAHGRACGRRAVRGSPIYASAETHTWIQKATDLFGLGTDAIRWIPVDERQRMKTSIYGSRSSATALEVISRFSLSGQPVRSVPAPSIRCGDIAAICRELDFWFHVDGAYGALAACVPDAPDDLRGLVHADSVAVDPHKWLYAPLEAGCVLVRRA